ncbi:HET-domain-containing protein [Hyaloscypha variabilis F]|uniref:HET-domain-containing protein n=1 Tax=Hyaloscypha variabilis (strain UAMH 11265 / GT02V1 / F) TaxID=1149755 RepID=A0A2J6QZZ5_HYAVF|nr:HET-domain-containing protein [Hyaloscypha variabilis F]
MNHIFHNTVYSSLVLVEDEIRLVRLLPSLASDEIDIEIEIIRANLTFNPQYEALSYEWGSPSDAKLISVQGQFRPVQPNLWWALRCLRLDSKPRMLWIDAICINQEDTGERNQQVTRMGRIYAQASRVIVWMGYQNTSDLDKEVAAAVAFLCDISLNSSEFAYRPNQPWKSLARLCHKSYWSRLWIIQEVVLATNILVQCGNDSFEWSILAGLLDQLDIFLDHPTFLQEKGLYQVGRTIHRSIPGRLHRQRIARGSEDSKAKSLLDLVMTYREAGCVDPRDKVFGLHSLAENCCWSAISVDYKKSAFEISGLLLGHHIFHHMEGSRLPAIATAAYLQSLLKITLQFKLYPWRLQPHDSYYRCAERRSIELPGTIEGNISWLSPFFDKLIEKPADLDNGKSSAQIRKTMSALGYPLEFWRQVPSRTPKDLYHWRYRTGLTFSLDNEASIAIPVNPTQPAIPRTSKSVRKFGDSVKASLKNRASILVEKFAVNDREIFRWWNWLISPCSFEEREWTRIFFCENGLVGFAPERAHVGDVVCRIDKSDNFVVLASSTKVYKITGRVSILSREESASTMDGAKPSKMQLNLDIPTLQLLSWTLGKDPSKPGLLDIKESPSSSPAEIEELALVPTLI